LNCAKPVAILADNVNDHNLPLAAYPVQAVGDGTIIGVEISVFLYLPLV